MQAMSKASNPDLDEIAIKRGIKRVHMEMRARMGRAYPTQRRQEIAEAQLAINTGLDLSTTTARIIAIDAEEFPKMLERLSGYRLAASLLIDGLNKGRINPHSFDFSDDTYWEYST